MQTLLVESTAKARLRAVVSGWVQGVGYRDFVSRVAVRHRLKGYVRNSSDGTVEIEAEGPRDELEAFLQELHGGHPVADVSRVDVAWDAFRDEFHDWDLRW
ncbi:MAG TPA: acylphosphatase [Candidatus Solibacter sp.]|nr:acylphosphatase [Candidatus Solibacter sp.]